MKQVRQLRRDNKAWPERLMPVPPAEWPQDHPGNSSGAAPRIAIWRSRDFLVQAFQEKSTATRLSVCRTDWDVKKQRWREDISWDDLQRLKSEAGFGDRMAVEIYPLDKDVVNIANMRHLWVLEDALNLGWRK